MILVSLAQSVHELTPPDVLTPVVRKLAQEFVHPGVGAEVISAGLNAIREVCRRQPWCMEEDLLGDLIEYRKSRDKGVVTAARGLLQLFREVNPGLLKKRERVSILEGGTPTSPQVWEQREAVRSRMPVLEEGSGRVGVDWERRLITARWLLSGAFG